MSREANFASKLIGASLLLNNVSQANTSKLGAGTLGSTVFKLLTAGIDGAKITKINIALLGSCSGSEIRLFVGDDSTRFLKTIVPIKPVYSNFSTESDVIEKALNIELLPNQSLYLTCTQVTSSSVNQFTVSLEGGNY